MNNEFTHLVFILRGETTPLKQRPLWAIAIQNESVLSINLANQYFWLSVLYPCYFPSGLFFWSKNFLIFSEIKWKCGFGIVLGLFLDSVYGMVLVCLPFAAESQQVLHLGIPMCTLLAGWSDRILLPKLLWQLQISGILSKASLRLQADEWYYKYSFWKPEVYGHNWIPAGIVHSARCSNSDEILHCLFLCLPISFTSFRRFGRGWCNVRSQTPSLGAGICLLFAFF